MTVSAIAVMSNAPHRLLTRPPKKCGLATLTEGARYRFSDDQNDYTPSKYRLACPGWAETKKTPAPRGGPTAL